MPRPWLERRRVHRDAQRKLGLKVKQQDRYEFMRVCIEQMTANGDASDENEAELICELLFEEQDIDLGDF